jgi:DNA-directed RNA polymerase subunit RPC12/RpoP
VLYRKIRADKRICNYYRCQQPILRNIDIDKQGRIYHHGCLMDAKDEKFRCNECFSTFDATEASFDQVQKWQGDDLKDAFEVVCPHCGFHLKGRNQIRGEIEA